MGTGRGINIPINFTTPNLANVAQRMQALVRAQNGLTRIAGITARYVGFSAVISKVTQTIKGALNNIKEIDKTITNIAVVTNMSQEELWGKMGQYMSMAKQYGTAVNDVYTVSQLFYQQGLQTAQVMSMTNETLKMAKIAGMDYAEAADAMTVAVRAFNIEMSNAQNVTDVYSALAANFAVSSQEIANAMEKTASSAASVGMSIESTSAFMSVMIQTTRESAENIGSAMKSIISRYGEMKASPNELLNVDGEEVSYNKVDKALKSIGISIKDANGQFRDFDDVIMELAGKWKTLDNNTQRYIATIMAGNRQQSRFIALVSNTDELNRAMDTANGSQSASLQQVLKTMDSIETKAQQMKSAFTDIYANWGLEETLKNVYDTITQMLKNIKNQGLETIAAMATQLTSLSSQFRGLAGVMGYASQGRATYWTRQRDNNGRVTYQRNNFQGTRQEYNQLLRQTGAAYYTGFERNEGSMAALISSLAGMTLNITGSTITAKGLTIEDKSTDNIETSKTVTGIGEAMSGLGILTSQIATGFVQGGVWGAIAGGVGGLIQAAPSFVAAIKNITDGLDYTNAERYGHAIEEANKANEEYVKAQAKRNDLQTQIEKIKSLEQTAYNSTESLAAYQAAINSLADTYPQLVSAYDSQGNAIIDLSAAEERLLALRLKESQAANNLSKAELHKEKYKLAQLEEIAGGQTGSAWSDYALTGFDIALGWGSAGDYTSIVSTNNGNIETVLAVEKDVAEQLAEMQLLIKDEQGNYSYAEGQNAETIKAKTQEIAADKAPNLLADGLLSLLLSPFLGSAALALQMKEVTKWENTQLIASTDTETSGEHSLKDFAQQIDEQYATLIEQEIIPSFTEWLKESGVNVDEAENVSAQELLKHVNGYRETIIEQLENEKELLEDYYKSISDSIASQTLINWETEKYNGNKYNFNRQEIVGTNKVISGLVDEALKNKLEEIKEYANLGEWYETNPEDFAEKASEITEAYADYVYNLNFTDDELQNFLTDLGDLSNYRSIEEVISKYGLAAEDISNEFWQAIAKQMTEQTEVARQLLFKQIHGNNISNNNHQFQDLDSNYNQVLVDSGMANSKAFQDLAVKADEWFNGENGTIQLTSKYAVLLAHFLGSINNLYKSGYSVEADRQLQIINDLYTDIVQLPSELAEEIYNTIATIDWTSRESIQATIDKLNEYTGQDLINLQEKNIFDDLQNAYDSVNINAISAYQIAMDKIAETTKNVASRYNTANSGLTADKALEEYNKFIATAEGANKDLSFNDLYRYDAALDKFVYTNKGLSEWIAKDTAAMEKSRNEAQNAAKNFAGLYKQLEDGKIWSQFTSDGAFKDWAQFGDEANFANTIYKEYVDAIKAGTIDSEQSFQTYMENKLKELTAVANQEEAIYTAYLQSHGQLIKNINWKDLASGKVSSTNKLQLQQLLGATAEDVEAWLNNFIHLNAEAKVEEYKKILKAKGIEINDAELKTIAADFANETASALGSTIDELLKGDGAVLSETAIHLLEIAQIDGVSVDEAGRLTIEAGQNAVDAALRLLEELQSSLSVAEYLDKKRSIFSSQSSIIEKGIKGSMSAADLQALGYDLSNLNGLITNTAEGYKFTTKGAVGAYSKLRATSPLQSSAFAASLAATKEYGDYAKVLAHVRDLTKQLNDAATSGKGELIAALQQELSLYQEIAAALYEQGDAFNFMSKALPTGIQNISDYFENAASAMEKLNAAVNDNNGNMAYKDFYNMMDHMQSQLKNSDIEGAEKQLENVQRLMALAAQTARTVDGTYSVNITQLCNSIGISTDDLGDAFTNSIHEMAKQQIEWIDAQIAMLEGFAVLEGIDVSGGEVSAFDQMKTFLMSADGLGETAEEAVQDIQKTAELLKAAGFGDNFKQFFDAATGKWIGTDTDLKQYIDAVFNELKERLGEDAQAFVDWLNTLDWSSFTKGGSFDINKLIEQFRTSAKTAEIPTEDLDIKLKLKADGTGAILEIGDNFSAEWNSNNGKTLTNFVKETIEEYNNEHGANLDSGLIKIKVSDITAEGESTVTGMLFYKQGRIWAQVGNELPTSPAAALATVKLWIQAGLLPKDMPVSVPYEEIIVHNGKAITVKGQLTYNPATDTSAFSFDFKDTGLTLAQAKDAMGKWAEDGKITFGPDDTIELTGDSITVKTKEGSEATVDAVLAYKPSDPNNTSCYKFNFNGVNGDVDSETAKNAIKTWAEGGKIDPGAIIELTGITVTTKDGEQGKVDAILKYTDGKVEYTSVSGRFGSGEKGTVVSGIADWAKGEGIKDTDVKLTKEFDIKSDGTGDVTAELRYNAATGKYYYGEEELASDKVVEKIIADLDKIGIDLTKLPAGTKIEVNGTDENGNTILKLNSPNLSASGEATVSCSFIVSKGDTIDEKTKKANQDTFDKWLTAVEEVKALIAAMESTDTTGLDGTTTPYGGVKTAILTSGLHVIVDDKGVTVEGGKFDGNNFESIAALISAIENQYTLDVNGKVEVTADNHGDNSGKKLDYSHGTKDVSGPAIYTPEGRWVEYETGTDNDNEVITQPKTPEGAYKEWLAKTNPEDLPEIFTYAQQHIAHATMANMFAESKDKNGNFDENIFYKQIIDLLADSNEIDKEQLENYKDNNSENPLGYNFNDLNRDWNLLTGNNNTSSEADLSIDQEEISATLETTHELVATVGDNIAELKGAYLEMVEQRNNLKNLQSQSEPGNADYEAWAQQLAEVEADMQTIEDTLLSLGALQQAIDNFQQAQSNGTEGVADALANLKSAFNDAKTKIEDIHFKVPALDLGDLPSKLKDLASSIGTAIDKIKGKTGAKGNVALAKGNALAKGTRTLMGELGPEMVVANGRYFIAGQNGAEFVDLPDDAIVFNHLQTASLLSNGHSGRGKAIHGDAAALAMAKGNLDGGPAKAGASDAIKALLALRAQWQNLLKLSAKDLASKSSGGGGGGGGGGAENKSVLHDLDRWYNLLRQIAKLEAQISLEQKKRANMSSGYSHIDSLEKELEMLEKMQKNYKQLSELQKSYYDQRREDLTQSAYSMFFTYDEDGLMQYRDENYHILEELNKVNVNKKGEYDAKQQIKILKDAGFDVSVLATNADGTKAEDDAAKMENFWDYFDSWTEELDNMYDSYHDYLEKIEDNQQQQIKIYEEFRQIQIDTENMLLNAIEAREQSFIDALQEEYDALRTAVDKYTNGLTNALNKERQMYEQSQNAQSLTQLQRQLAVLQRSGGSASAIKSLQDQIDSQLQDQYFTERQNEIEAIREASDAQLEKMQTQIDLMAESLEYQKEHGLLWNEVNTMMHNWDATNMADFIAQWSKEYEGMSATQRQKEMVSNLKTIESWIEYLAHHGSFSDWYEANSSDIMGRMRQLGATSGQLDGEANQAKLRAVAQEAYEKAIRSGASNSAAQEAAEAAIKNYLGLNSAVYNPGQFVEPPVNGATNGGGNGSGSNSTINGTGTHNGSQSEGNGGTLPASTVTAIRTDYWKTLERLGSLAKGSKEYNEATAHLDTLESKYGGRNGDIDYLVWYKDQRDIKGYYSEGGEVKYTGLAMVHGSPSKPEAFLSADDRALMKSSIFSNKAKTVVAVMEQFSKFAEGLSTKYERDVTDSMGLNIENVSINLDPGVISDDYDARRAAQTVMDEIVKIARQTNNLGLSRR